MCGVVGAYLTNVTKYDLTLLENVLLESRIRGLHASGISYVKGDRVYTEKEPLCIKQFLARKNLSNYVDNNDIKMIGHIRYSTSDLRFNQPFDNGEIAIVHNGVISQDPNVWEYNTETLNDSELILRCLENGDNPLEIYKHRSMACVALESNRLVGWRNHKRPLWTAKLENGIIFASTRDILKRAGIEENVERCEPLVLYSFTPEENALSLDYDNKDSKIMDLQP